MPDTNFTATECTKVGRASRRTSGSRVARAVVLALFVPLIISSGGNSGTFVIRAIGARKSASTGLVASDSLGIGHRIGIGVDSGLSRLGAHSSL
jgi:hypothetical protein